MKFTRRQILAAGAGLPARAAAPRAFRLAISSKTFEGSPFPEVCQTAGRTGFTGLEIAPFTLSDEPAALPPARLAEFRGVMESEGIGYVGLHSVLGTTPLSVTTPDARLRKKSWDYFRRMIDLGAALGDAGTMVFLGSPQRRTVGGSTPRDAIARIKEGLAEAAPVAADRGVTIVVEPIAPHLCDVINTLAEALDVVTAVGSPAVQSMLDTHNTAAEKQPAAELIRRYWRHLRHVHFNEMDGRRPGTGSYDFKTVLQVLKDLSYAHWISVEAFDLRPDGVTVATESARFIRRLEAELT